MSKKLKLPKKKSKWKLLGLSKENTDAQMIGSAHIEVFGSGRVSIDGCLGVYEYKDTYIKLRLLKGAVIIAGSDLSIVYFENRLISIKGKICDIEFV